MYIGVCIGVCVLRARVVRARVVRGAARVGVCTCGGSTRGGVHLWQMHAVCVRVGGCVRVHYACGCTHKRT